ncbi:MAG: hypothetical protein PVI03_06670 [Candidatus Thorarchaeota archaeon]|jgi:hypothetical protein
MRWLREWWKSNGGYVTTVCVVIGIFMILLMPMPEGMRDMFPDTPQERCEKDCIGKGYESGKYDGELFQTFEECWCYEDGNVTQIW